MLRRQAGAAPLASNVMPELDRSAMIVALERELGCDLPPAYAAFLRSHGEQLLEPALLYPLPPGTGYGDVGVAHVLLRIEDLLENSRREVIGLPDRQLMQIGHSLLSPNLYMCFSDAKFGAIYACDPFKSDGIVPVAKSFEEFISACTRDVEA